jgi:hypothetical protein
VGRHALDDCLRLLGGYASGPRGSKIELGAGSGAFLFVRCLGMSRRLSCDKAFICGIDVFALSVEDEEDVFALCVEDRTTRSAVALRILWG